MAAPTPSRYDAGDPCDDWRGATTRPSTQPSKRKRKMKNRDELMFLIYLVTFAVIGSLAVAAWLAPRLGGPM